MPKKTAAIRQEFLNFFVKKGHKIIESSNLIPNNDQTLLFTNAGMNQFKNVFLGIEKSQFKRVTTAQRCVRAGGKHNDLDNVGYTDQHLTFFEMLGNFSFGDYFKEEAIQFAWELLTSANWFNLPKKKLWVTVNKYDNESYDIWKKIVDIPDDHIIKIGDATNNILNSENFWQMGALGPCGPCSEIFFDYGEQFSGEITDNSKISKKRYVEIWNLVFIQFNLEKNGSLSTLPIVSVDTGMGLERISAVLQGVHSNYSIDIFKNLIFSIANIIKIDSMNDRSIYVLADHIRTCVFLIKDGVLPSNEGRGYVLRRIIRRAILHGKKIGIDDIFFYKLVSPLIQHTKDIYNNLHHIKNFVEEVLINEEKLFEITLNKGLKFLKKKLNSLRHNVLSGKEAFDLYDTHGFPLELTKSVCLQYNVDVNQTEFDKYMLQQKNHIKTKIIKNSSLYQEILTCDISSIFIGYDTLSYTSQIIKLFNNEISVKKISAQDNGIVILQKTPFYGESGGQIGDCGKLYTKSGIFQVKNTKKYGNAIGHIGYVINGAINLGEEASAQVQQYTRKYIAINHSATHLLRVALIKVLGSHIIQKGSLIDAKHLRFDFSHNIAMTTIQINEVENFVNKQIWNNLNVKTNIIPIETAKNINAVMLPDTEYQKTVRVLNIGNISNELCGGTHVKNTGEIGIFLINKEFSIASGIRRIEAVTNDIALSTLHNDRVLLKNILQETKSNSANILNDIRTLKYCYQKLTKEMQYLQNTQILQQYPSWIKDIYYIGNIKILIKQVVHMMPKTLLTIVDYFKNQLESGIIIFINMNKNNKINLIIAITKNLITLSHINAVDLIHRVTNIFGGKGGGKPDLAQGGIQDNTTTNKVSIEINAILRQIL
ncbi:alanine--tRNA ligase [Candidatus Blochmannia ocreatus (nom. nud.)]|uniref:Alanine--tRNA ligase n=1 Tax=Candidatus Blochmannia ocreatus (nom. nud.) TaxID=251538 RepID=A0ABY4STE3_9ENTR|nr:alanine--tRNA ligase [Candidatus Blochmannia ocreatus]URJ25251.1 alanine--tRNA ligase [Candidatus Blochmannia ocreatus]